MIMRKLTIIFLFLMVNVWFALGWTPPSPITPPDTIPDAVANMNFGILGGNVAAGGGSLTCTQGVGIAWNADDSDLDYWGLLTTVSYQEVANSTSIEICKIVVQLYDPEGTAACHVEIWDLARTGQVGGDPDEGDITLTDTTNPGTKYTWTWTTEPNPTADFVVELFCTEEAYLNTNNDPESFGGADYDVFTSAGEKDEDLVMEIWYLQ